MVAPRNGTRCATGGDAGHGREEAAVEIFYHRDDDYARWLAEHPAGYVLNARRGNPPSLHRATCRNLRPVGTARGTSATAIAKVCGTDRSELEAWARAAGRAVVPCANCRA
jgi:hypothetical protein